MDNSKKRSSSSVKRVGGYLHKVVPVFDVTGKLINYGLLTKLAKKGRI